MDPTQQQMMMKALLQGSGAGQPPEGTPQPPAAMNAAPSMLNTPPPGAMGMGQPPQMPAGGTNMMTAPQMPSMPAQPPGMAGMQPPYMLSPEQQQQLQQYMGSTEPQ